MSEVLPAATFFAAVNPKTAGHLGKEDISSATTSKAVLGDFGCVMWIYVGL